MVTMRSIGFEGQGTFPEGRNSPVGKYYLFVIAIDKYDEAQVRLQDENGNEYIAKKFPALNNPVTDAARFVNLMLSKYRFFQPDSGTTPNGYPPEVMEYDTLQTKCLYNRRANAAAIRSHITSLSNELTKDDCLLIYYAGHGDDGGDGSSGYLIPFNAENDRVSKTNWLPFDNLYNPFSRSPNGYKCRDLLLILDCCFAGTVNMGMINKVPLEFSRFGLVSSSTHQTASDGVMGKGSCFANALIHVLNENEHPFAAIDRATLVNTFHTFYSIEFDEVPEQKIYYDTLPMEVGTSEFVFELRNPNDVPVEKLSRTIITHLNFIEQKYDLANQYEENGLDDFVIISTICKNFNLHKLQGKVMFEALKYYQQLKLQFSSPIIIRPDLFSNNPWNALAAYLGVMGDQQQQTDCVVKITDRLLRDEKMELPDQPLIIYLDCKFQTQEQSVHIIRFCKQFYDEVCTVKQKTENKDKRYDRLFLVIADTREGKNSFFSRQQFIDEIGDKPKVIISRAVDDLPATLAREWHKKSKEEILSRKFQAFDPDSFFRETKRCDLEKFILGVGLELKVDQTRLVEQLWHF